MVFNILAQKTLMGSLAVTDLGNVYMMDDGSRIRFDQNLLNQEVMFIQPDAWKESQRYIITSDQLSLGQQCLLCNILEPSHIEKATGIRQAIHLKVLKELDSNSRNRVQLTFFCLGVA